MPAVNLVLPALHDGQKLIFRPRTAKFGVFPCGTKLGKTLGFSIKIIQKAITEGRERDFGWLAPYRETADIGFKYCQRMIPPHLFTANKSKKTITFKHNGNCIHFLGVNVDPENAVEGKAFHYIVMDEVSKMPRQAFDSARTTTTRTKAKIDLISTPRGKGWFFDLFCDAQDKFNLNFDGITLPTEANPFVDREEIAIARATMPSRLFEQYYLAKFLDSSEIFAALSSVVVGDSIEFDQDNFQLWLADGVQSRRVVIGADWARQQDYTCFVAMTIDETKPRIVGFNRIFGKGYLDQIKDLIRFCHNFAEVQVVQHDKTGVGIAVDDMLSQTHLPFEGMTWTNESKAEMVNQLIVGVEQQALVIPRVKPLIDEMDAYEMTPTNTGKMRYSAPNGKHDDGVAALLMAWQAACQYHGHSFEVLTLDDILRGEDNPNDWYTTLMQELQNGQR